jgi:hypothetical protein
MPWVAHLKEKEVGQGIMWICDGMLGGNVMVSVEDILLWMAPDGKQATDLGKFAFRFVHSI